MHILCIITEAKKAGTQGLREQDPGWRRTEPGAVQGTSHNLRKQGNGYVVETRHHEADPKGSSNDLAPRLRHEKGGGYCSGHPASGPKGPRVMEYQGASYKPRLRCRGHKQDARAQDAPAHIRLPAAN